MKKKIKRPGLEDTFKSKVFPAERVKINKRNKRQEGNKKNVKNNLINSFLQAKEKLNHFASEVFPVELQEINKRREFFRKKNFKRFGLIEETDSMSVELRIWSEINPETESEEKLSFGENFVQYLRKLFDIEKKPKKSPLPPSANYNLTGLALSGGGVRSATFNLGVLQALADGDMLKDFDYLSTVSGGGYIGSCVSSLSHSAEQEGIPSAPGDNTFPLKSNDGQGENKVLGFLRNVSAKYLSPPNFFSAIRMGSFLVRGWIINLLLFLPWSLFLALLIYLLFGEKINGFYDTKKPITDFLNLIPRGFLILVLTALIWKPLEPHFLQWQKNRTPGDEVKSPLQYPIFIKVFLEIVFALCFVGIALEVLALCVLGYGQLIPMLSTYVQTHKPTGITDAVPYAAAWILSSGPFWLKPLLGFSPLAIVYKLHQSSGKAGWAKTASMAALGVIPFLTTFIIFLDFCAWLCLNQDGKTCLTQIQEPFLDFLNAIGKFADVLAASDYIIWVIWGWFIAACLNSAFVLNGNWKKRKKDSSDGFLGWLKRVFPRIVSVLNALFSGIMIFPLCAWFFHFWMNHPAATDHPESVVSGFYNFSQFSKGVLLGYGFIPGMPVTLIGVGLCFLLFFVYSAGVNFLSDQVRFASFLLVSAFVVTISCNFLFFFTEVLSRETWIYFFVLLVGLVASVLFLRSGIIAVLDERRSTPWGVGFSIVGVLFLTATQYSNLLFPNAPRYGASLITSGGLVVMAIWLTSSAAKELFAGEEDKAVEKGKTDSKAESGENWKIGLLAFLAIASWTLAGIFLQFALKPFDPLAQGISQTPLFYLGTNWGYALELMMFAWLLFYGVFLIVDVNSSSLHKIYRDQLSAAYLFIWKNEVESNDGQLLSELNQAPKGNDPGPYHLINATVNLPASHSSKSFDLNGRKGSFFFFSKLYCGGPYVGFVKTDDLEQLDPDLNLGTAMAISGAAVSPNMGTQTPPFITPFLCALNVRLGYWLPNVHCQDGKWRGLMKQINPRMAKVGFWFLLKEMFRVIDETSSYINLSDGGHIENLGVYELLRRHAKLIVACDAEYDPNYTFDGLARVIRYAKMDMGIDVDINVNPIKRNKNGICRQSVRVGTIHYGRKNNETGILVYVKSSLPKLTDQDILNYSAEYSNFPHESTADQFFSEGQFEAYRRLGHHIGQEAVTQIKHEWKKGISIRH